MSHRPPPGRNRTGRARTGAAAALTAAVLAAAGCASGDYGGSGLDQETFVYLSSTDIVTEWDPAASYSNELVAFPGMYETLTRYDPESEKVEPLLATEWTPSDDSKTWTFTLRDGVKFHSGAPLTADAAKKAIERTIEEKAGAAYLWDPVERIEAEGDDRLVFTLSRPAPLDLISSASYAAYIYEVPAKAKDFEAKSFGTGPYTVQNWAPGKEKELTLKSFADYWGGWKGEHYKKVEYHVVPQGTTAAKLMESQKAHYAQNLSPSLLEGLRDDPQLDIPRSTSWQNLFGLLNTAKPPLDDPEVRRALAHAVDYDELIEATDGAFVGASGVIPEGLIGHQKDAGAPAYDPDEAKRLLKAAGYGPGKKDMSLELTYTEGEEDVETMTALMQSQLKKVGVDLKVSGLPWESAQWPMAQEKDPDKRQDILLMYWWPDDPQPLSWYQNLFRTEDDIVFNLAYFSDKKLDGMIDEVGPLTATDPAAAERTYGEMQGVLNEEVPALLLGTKVYQRTLNKGVGGFKDNPMYANVVFVHDLTPGEPR